MSANPFPATSRYQGLETAQTELPGGRTVTFLRRRFLPPADGFALLREHVVAEGDRLDNVTARHLGDPLQFWRLCDANSALHPAELEEVGRRLRITLPEGVPGGA